MAPYFKGAGPANTNLDDNNVDLRKAQIPELKIKKTEQPSSSNRLNKKMYLDTISRDLLQSKYVTSNINNNVTPSNNNGSTYRY